MPEIVEPTTPDSPAVRTATPWGPVLPESAPSSDESSTAGSTGDAPETTATEPKPFERAPLAKPTTPKPAAVTLTISEAARACSVGRGTIRHHRQAGDFPGAFKDQDGMWRIPVEDLEWVGFEVDLGRVAEEPVAASKMDLLRTEVAVLRERLRAAELIAMEREKRIDDLRLILRLLPPSSVPASFLPGRGRAGAGAPAGLTAGTEPKESSSPSAAGESDPVIWLPESSEARAVPVAGRPRSAEADRGSIWTPGAPSTPEGGERLPPAPPAQLVPPPLDVGPRSRRWRPWRRLRR